MRAMVDLSDPSPDAPHLKNTEVACYCSLGGVMDLLSRCYAMQVICVVGAIGPTGMAK